MLPIKQQHQVPCSKRIPNDPQKTFAEVQRVPISEILGTIFFNRVNRAQEIVSHLNTSLPSPSVKRSQLNIFFFLLSPGDPFPYWGAIKGIWKSNQQQKTDGRFHGNHRFISGMLIKLMPFFQSLLTHSLFEFDPFNFHVATCSSWCLGASYNRFMSEITHLIFIKIQMLQNFLQAGNDKSLVSYFQDLKKKEESKKLVMN